MSESSEALSFEDALRELEETIRRLETGDLTLEQAIALYERGMFLTRRCTAALDAAELQVQTLVI